MLSLFYFILFKNRNLLKLFIDDMESTLIHEAIRVYETRRIGGPQKNHSII